MSKRNRSSFDSERARLAGLRSAEARRRRAEATPPGYQADTNGGGAHPGQENQPPYPVKSVLTPGEAPSGSTEIGKGVPVDLAAYSIEGLHALAEDERTPAYVRRQALEALGKVSLPVEPVRVSGEEPRQHSLIDVIRMAVRSGVATEPGFRAALLEAMREGAAEAEAERAEPVCGGTLPADPESTPESEYVVTSGPSGPAIYDDNGNWVLIDGADRAAEITKFNLELERRESERLVSGWVDPDRTSGEAA